MAAGTIVIEEGPDLKSPGPLSADSLDRRGYHALQSSFSRPFHVEKRWSLKRELGQGAYGMVVSAEDTVSGETVAIKMVTRVFDKVQLAKRALREIMLLRHFSMHENITGLIDIDVIHPDFNEIYLFLEPMEADLHQIIRSGQPLTSEHVQYFLYQTLRGLKYIHSASVIHRDLKPGNLLVNADCELKICDFGLANTFEGVGHLTEYVATRWYRAPEIMLSFQTYTTAIDMWSVGCILGELLLGRPIFRGKDYVDQLNRILEVLGSPDHTIINRICSGKAKAYVRSLPFKKAQPFKKLLPIAEDHSLDLLSKMISWDPEARLSVTEALAHPWLANYHDLNDEPECPSKFTKWKVYEELETLKEFRRAIWEEIQDFRNDVRSAYSPLTSPGDGTEHQVVFPISEESVEERRDEKPEEPPLGALSEAAEPKVEAAEQLSIPQRRDSATLASANDPFTSYRRRSSTIGSSVAPTQTRSRMSSSAHGQPPGNLDSATTDGDLAGSFVIPARSRAGSVMGAEPQVLRTLSTYSLHEKVAGEALDKLIAQQRTGAEAPPSEMPVDFENRG